MGSILATCHQHDDDDISIAGGEVAPEISRIRSVVVSAVGAGVAGSSSREGGAPSSSSSSRKSGGQSSKKKCAVVESRDIKATNRQPPVNSAAAAFKEKRKGLALIKNLPSNSKSKSIGIHRGGRGRTMQRGSGISKTRSAATKSSSAEHRTSFASNKSSDKENDTCTMISTPPTRHATSGSRVPLDPIAERKNQMKPASEPGAATNGKKKKLRAAAASYNLRRNGSSKSGSNDKVVSSAPNEATMKIPVDPPGAILGALPWMHHPHHNHHSSNNGQQQHQQMMSTEQTVNMGGHLYGCGHPNFQHPVFPPMNNWGYQPASHHQEAAPAAASSNQADHHRQWQMPPFLRSVIHHPFANFMGSNGNHHGNTGSWPASGGAGSDVAGANHFSHMVHNAVVAQHNSRMERATTEQSSSAAQPPEEADEEDDDAMSVDESMASSTEAVVETPKKEETKFILSTFAPKEYVEEIRSRNEVKAAAKQPSGNDAVKSAVQTRSMTAKKNRDQRDSSVRSSSSHSPSSSNTASAAAHQACSPRSNASSSSKGSASKMVDAVDSSVDLDSPAPQIMTVLGKKVTMIDPVRKVFVIDLLSPENCDQIRMMADNHTREVHRTGSTTATWRTLYTYTRMDLPVVEVKDMVKKYTDNILLDVKKIVGEIFGGSMRKDAMKLRPRSWKEPHLLLYQALDGRPPHTGIEMHYDGCDITWQAMLTRIDEYEGGGTYFRCLKKTVKLQQGQVLVHPGELYHKGVDITNGVRCLLVCFTDGMNPKILDDSKSEDHNEKDEKRVLVC